MKLTPLGDRVVLKQLVAEETTKSGIVLPGQNKEKPQQAEVIAVGPGGVVDGKEVKMEVKVGDNVTVTDGLFEGYKGTFRLYPTISRTLRFSLREETVTCLLSLTQRA